MCRWEKLQGNARSVAITKSKPDRNLVSVQDKQAYKQILLQSSAHRVIVPRVRSKQTKVLNISGLFRNCLLIQRKCFGNRYNNNVLGCGLLRSQTWSRVWVSSKPSKVQ